MYLFELGKMDHGKHFYMEKIKNLEVPKVDITPLDGFDFSEALESVYPLLENIFGFLNVKDLKTCCKVKETWKEVAEKMLEKRKKCSWFSFYSTKTLENRKKTGFSADYCSNTVEPRIIVHNSNFYYNDVEIGIIFYSQRRIDLFTDICIDYNMERSSCKTVPEHLEDLLPQNMNYCLISCPKVVSYFNGIKKTDGFNLILDGLILPKIPKIRTDMFYCNPLKTDVRKFLDIRIKKNEEIKCVLLFSRNAPTAIWDFLQYFKPVNNASSVAVGGALVNGLQKCRQVMLDNTLFTCNNTFCILFLQKQGSQPNFNAFSFKIDGMGLTKRIYEEKLLKFKQQIILRANSVAFRMSATQYSEKELALFGKVFPNIPLLGMNVAYAVGGDCFFKPEKNDNGESNGEKAEEELPDVYIWSTIFVLITWGPLRSK